MDAPAAPPAAPPAAAPAASPAASPAPPTAAPYVPTEQDCELFTSSIFSLMRWNALPDETKANADVFLLRDIDSLSAELDEVLEVAGPDLVRKFKGELGLLRAQVVFAAKTATVQGIPFGRGQILDFSVKTQAIYDHIAIDLQKATLAWKEANGVV